MVTTSESLELESFSGGCRFKVRYESFFSHVRRWIQVQTETFVTAEADGKGKRGVNVSVWW